MIYCFGIKVKSGLVVIVDICIIFGNEIMIVKKIFIYKSGKKNFFIMIFGLWLICDKVVIYFEELLEFEDFVFDKMYKVVNVFGD